MNELEKLNSTDRDRLLKAPVYLSLLAANADGKLDAEEKKEAIKVSHVKTYSGAVQLRDYYNEVEAAFDLNVEHLDLVLPNNKEDRSVAIKIELTKLSPVFAKLSPVYAMALYESLKSFTKHVSKAHNNVLENFLIPLEIRGFNS